MTSIAIDIIVPAYNAAQTIAETLNSAINQNGVAEVIVIDDGSTDNTLAVAKRFGPRVKVLSIPNQGVSAARNRGIAETSAPWIVFLDADDLLLPNTIAQRLKAASTENADVVVSDWRDLIDAGDAEPQQGAEHRIDWSALAADAELAVATHVWATTAAILYRRTTIEKVGGFRLDLPVIQDARLLFDVARTGARFAHADHIGAEYRVRAGSLSRRNPAAFWRDVFTNGRQIEAIWRDDGQLGAERLQGLADIYNNAARGLFAACDPAYFIAVATQRSLGLPVPRHSRFAAPLARVVGLRAARSLIGLTRAA